MLRMGDRRYNLYITFSVSLHLCKLAVCYAVPCSGVAPGPSEVPLSELEPDLVVLLDQNERLGNCSADSV